MPKDSTISRRGRTLILFIAAAADAEEPCSAPPRAGKKVERLSARSLVAAVPIAKPLFGSGHSEFLELDGGATNIVEIYYRPGGVIVSDIKPVRWVGTARDDLQRFSSHARVGTSVSRSILPRRVTSIPRRNLSRVSGGAGVLEIVEKCEGDSYRAVYTVRFADVVYVLHAFKKKSKRGIKTPKHEIDLLKQRLRHAEEDYRSSQPSKEGNVE